MYLTTALDNPKTILVSIVAAVLVMYGSSITFENVLDDTIITEHPYVLEGISATGKIFSSGFLKAYNGVSVSYRPLSTFTFALDQTLTGGSPAARRFINLLLYALCGFLIWMLSKSWFPKQNNWFHAMVAALFIAHPIHTEAVSNMKSRDEILTLLFLLGSLVYLDKYMADKKNLSLGLSVGSFFLSLLCKESAVSFIIIIPLVLYVFYKQSWKEIGRVIVPFVAPFVVYFILRLMVLDGVSATGLTHLLNNSFVESNGILDRLASSSYLLLLYFQKLLVPVGLCWDYGYPVIKYIPLSSGLGMASVAGAVILAAVGIYLLFKRNVFGWAIICIIASLSLVLNFLVLIGANFAERFLFTPSLFFTIALAVAFSYGLNQTKYQGITKGLLAFVLVFYSYQTFTRNLDWKNPESLFLSSLETHPESSRVQTAVGTLYRGKAEQMPPSPQQEKLYMKALKHYELAVKALDGNFEAWFNTGVIYQSTGRLDLAEKCFNKVVEINAEYTGAYNNLGFLAFNRKDYTTALDYFMTADSLQPNNPKVIGNIASAYHNMGKYDQARPYYEKSLSLNPNQPDVRANYGKLPK